MEEREGSGEAYLGEVTNMIALEHERADSEAGMVPAIERVSAFLELAARDSTCSLVVLSTKYLRNKQALGLATGKRFRVYSPSEVNRTELLKACMSHGHLSVFFLPQKSEELLRAFEELRFYGQATRVSFGAGDAGDPLGTEGALALADFLVSTSGPTTQAMLGFSHDADQFYEVYPWRT